MLHASNVSGWADELPARMQYVVTNHAAIASIAIVVLLILIAQVLPKPRAVEDEDDDLY